MPPKQNKPADMVFYSGQHFGNAGSSLCGLIFRIVVRHVYYATQRLPANKRLDRDDNPQAPPAPPGIVCAPGLEYLALVDQIIIQQQVELLEAILHYETCNAYVAKNSMGQFMYNIAESKITKQWSGLARELFTDADTFGVTFPLDLDVHVKGALIAATMLIDYLFFEETHQKGGDDVLPGMAA
ncbi:hypothetical protein HPB49_020217 [Dermacentor silvarum]|uniref:Uncharacterized protein n=1 Tax=Dermacentor silvarum TaxID=543639 RepID=A0ACB8DFW4_DERSI|nr:hypothetical protein HPB49_020217 [Dermacentor silvarum]